MYFVDLQLVRQKDISLRSTVNACFAVLKDFKEDDLEVGTDLFSQVENCFSETNCKLQGNFSVKAKSGFTQPKSG